MKTTFGTSLGILWKSTIENRELILNMIKRDISSRYKGSILGMIWSVFNPLLLLAVYTFTFSYVFKARWPIQETENHTHYSLILFVGLILHGMLAEVIAKSPHLIVGNTNFVKRVVFPLEVLPWTVIGAAMFQAAVSFLVLFAGLFLFDGRISPTAIFLPLVLFPFAFMMAGISWFLSAVSVYIRDVQQIVAVVTTILLFVSPVFYSLSVLPEKIHFFARLNPLTVVIEEGRNAVVFGVSPNWSILFIYFLVSILVAWLGFAFFQKTRRGFADVL